MSMNKKHGLGRGLEALLGDDDLSFSLDNINTVSYTHLRKRGHFL